MKVLLSLLAVVLVFTFGMSFILLHVKPPAWIAVPMFGIWIIGSAFGSLAVFAALADWAERKERESHSPMGKKL